MKIKELFREIEENLVSSRKIFAKDFFQDDKDDLRSLDDSKIILSSLEQITEDSHRLIKDYPSLEHLFEKRFGKFSYWINRENILEVLFREDYLVPDSAEYPLPPQEQQLEGSLLENYVKSHREWIDKLIASHNMTQSEILNDFNIELKQSQLACQCLKCIADFRAKVRDSIFQEQKQAIETASEKIADLMLEKDITYISDYVTKIKRQKDRELQKIRYKLKRSSLNKLDADLKSFFKLHLGPDSDVGKTYIERLKSYFQGLLAEEGHAPDLLTDVEYERFFKQVGLGIWKSPQALKRDFQKLLKSVIALKRKDISASILRDYLGQFWIHAEARRKNRRVIYHMGPTNSGKTYNAIEALSKAEKGCYLAPLRLLASELYDTLNNKGVKTTLLTGEEVIEVENATHTSSTIEMAKLNEEFDCVVIDEIQMITDSQRGWAWTRALVNINADEIHLCGDHSVFELVQQILELTGDTLEVEQYERMTKLSVLPRQIRLVDMEKNDALIVFSRRNALKYKRDLENLNFKVSIVYGRLSPEVRREQARKFDEGETDIMVATDAIAMGMNLPIKRIVFSATSKYIDGKEFPLSNSELKQISGRAGRFQRFPEGQVTALQKVDDATFRLEEALNSNLKQREYAMVGPDLDIFRSVNRALEENNLKTLTLSEFLQLFNTMTFEKPFYCVDLREMIELTEIVEGADTMEALSDAEIFGFACAPVNQGLMEHVQYYVWILNHYVGRRHINNENIEVDSDDIDYLETAIKCTELYQWLARHFDNNYFEFDMQALQENKSQAIEQLNALLSEKVSKKCSSCGVKLKDDFQFNICETCFSERRGRRGPNRGSSRGSNRGGSRGASRGGSRGRNQSKKTSSKGRSQNKRGGKKKSKASAFKRG